MKVFRLWIVTGSYPKLEIRYRKVVRLKLSANYYRVFAGNCNGVLFPLVNMVVESKRVGLIQWLKGEW